MLSSLGPTAGRRSRNGKSPSIQELHRIVRHLELADAEQCRVLQSVIGATSLRRRGIINCGEKVFTERA